MKKRFFFKVLLGLALSAALFLQAAPRRTTAQGETPVASASGPVYIVQSGDSLWSIALRFRVSMDALSQANGITNANQLTVGSSLIIPGLEGMQGTLTTLPVPFGESLTSLSRRYRIPTQTLVELNHLTSPSELFAGTNLVVLTGAESSSSDRRSVLAPGQSLLELAVAQGVSPWAYVKANNLSGSAAAIPGDVLHLPGAPASAETSTPAPVETTPAGENAAPEPGGLPDAIRSVTLDPLPFVQGKTVVIKIDGESGMTLGGSLLEHSLNIFPDESIGGYVGLQGIHAMAEPGLYPMVITGTLPGGASFAFSQAVLVNPGDYIYDNPLTVPPETIDPAATRPEDAEWAALTAPVTPARLWSGIFASPAPPIYSDCFPSIYGSRRSYNGSEYTYFHTGLDFCGGVGTEIFAPAAGRVVFAGPLTVRGNATVIDHGQGVFTAYLHQSEFLVNVGDVVQPGQVIGKVGGTGRVTGPHLHWEVWVGGVQVQPMDWLEEEFPH